MDWNPEDYARNSGAQLAWAREFISRLNLAGNEALLDVGCGDGKVTAEFATVVPQGFVLGIDSSSAFIDYARLHYPPSLYPNLQFEQMDARELAHTRRFDVIFSNATLHWVEDHRAFLLGCARLLKPQGRLIISCGGQGNAADVFAVIDELIREPRWAPHFEDFSFPYFFYSPSKYERWLTEAGFHPMRLELVEKDMTHHGREGLAGWIRTTWMPYTHRVPADKREKFIFECVDGYLKKHPVDKLWCSHVKMVRLEVEAHI
ncbi:MAG: methyltransferase domain-containing protein [Dehalococcoidia bacterium]|nr:methyltransferase domain-containing protein [Dehalococcoidia bacterium]